VPNTDACVVIYFSARNGGITVVDDKIKEIERDALHLPPDHLDLNPIELVCGEIQNRVAQKCMSTNLKEVQILCEQVFAEFTKKNGKYAVPT
jgi:hypothetical protein